MELATLNEEISGLQQEAASLRTEMKSDSQEDYTKFHNLCNMIELKQKFAADIEREKKLVAAATHIDPSAPPASNLGKGTQPTAPTTPPLYTSSGLDPVNWANANPSLSINSILGNPEHMANIRGEFAPKVWAAGGYSNFDPGVPYNTLVVGDRDIQATSDNEKEYKQLLGYSHWLKTNQSASDMMMLDKDGALGGISEYAMFHNAMVTQADNKIAAGYFVVPQATVNTIIRTVDDMVYIRGLSTKLRVGRAQSLGVLVRKTRPSKPVWVAEIGKISEADPATYGKREFVPSMSAQYFTISQRMLDAPGISAEAQMRREAVSVHAETQEYHFLYGNGAQQPVGLLGDHEDGIGTDRDSATSNTQTAITTDGLVYAQYHLKAPYWRNAVWMFHRLALRQIRLLKDDDGRYLWQPALTAGQPGTIMGYPFIMNEWMPSDFTADKFVGLWGDFSTYWIVDSMNMQIQRLNELFALTSRVGYAIRWELDGAPTQPEAFVRLKTAA